MWHSEQSRWDNLDPSDFDHHTDDAICNACEDREEVIEKTNYWLKGVLEALYETGNTKDLENCLEEACHLLGIKFLDKEILIKLRDAA